MIGRHVVLACGARGVVASAALVMGVTVYALADGTAFLLGDIA